jgi:hypothetical protein
MIVAVGKEDVFVVGIKPIQAVQQAADVGLAAADDVRQSARGGLSQFSRPLYHS